jgi:hypothetical protein
MRSEELYNYLTGICKKKGLAIEGLPKSFRFSRSSLYRYMTGIGHMSPEIRAKFIRVLRLDDMERREFERLLGLSSVDSAMVTARQAFDGFVFGQKAAPAPAKTFNFAYHEKDTFLRGAEQIYALIEDLCRQPQTSCVVRMINCLGKDIAASLLPFIEKLLTASENVAVEHLLALPEKAYARNINTLIGIIPLLKYKSYSVYYGAKLSAIDFYEDKLIINVNLGDGQARYFFLSFHKDDLSHCLATPDKNVFDFWSSNYEYFKKHHEVSILDYAGIDMFTNALLELQQKTDHYLLKPNFCYDDIPMSVYQSILARASTEELATINNALVCAADGEAVCSQAILANIEQRIATTYTNRRVNVHSMDGLRKLTATGRLSDHFTFMPSFNKEELRTILEHARDRNSDPKDSYTLFITKGKILPDGHIFFAFENTGILLEYDQDNYRKGIANNLW